MIELRIPIPLRALLLAGATSAIASAQTPAAPEQPTLSDDAKLERVKGLYRAGKYKECADAFDQLLDPKQPGLTDRDAIESARIWDAVCLLGDGDKQRADDSLRKALDANRLMAQPDNLTYPQAVIDEFLAVRDSMRAAIDKAEAERRAADQQRLKAAQQRAADDRARLARLVDLASTREVTQVNQRWIAAIPFGVGQFQNRQDALGWLFLTSESLLAATALTSVYVRTQLDAEEVRLTNTSALGSAVQDAKNLNATWHAVSQISGWGLLGVAAIGITHAELTFVPQFRRTDKRKLPPDLERLPEHVGTGVTPEIAAVPGGVSLGFSLSF